MTGSTYLLVWNNCKANWWCNTLGVVPWQEEEEESVPNRILIAIGCPESLNCRNSAISDINNSFWAIQLNDLGFLQESINIITVLQQWDK